MPINGHIQNSERSEKSLGTKKQKDCILVGIFHKLWPWAFHISPPILSIAASASSSMFIKYLNVWVNSL